MPDTSRDNGLDNLRLAGGVLGSAAVVILLGSLLAYVTGDGLRDGRTHMDATLVLLVMGVALAVASLIVFVELKDRR